MPWRCRPGPPMAVIWADLHDPPKKAPASANRRAQSTAGEEESYLAVAQALFSRCHGNISRRSLTTTAAEHADYHLPGYGEAADDEDHVTEGTHPAQGLQQRLLHELFATGIP